MAWVNLLDEHPGYALQVLRDVGGGFESVDPSNYASLGIAIDVTAGRIEFTAPDIDSSGGGYAVSVTYPSPLGLQTLRLVEVAARCNDDPETPLMVSAAQAGTEGSPPQEADDVDGQAVVEFTAMDLQMIAVLSTRSPI